MSYRNLISCHVSDATAEAFAKLAQSRDSTMAAVLREMIDSELGPRPAFDLRMHNCILFNTIALDALLQASTDPTLRDRVLKAWQERVAERDAGND